MANYAASIYGESIIGEVPTPKVLAMGRDFEMTLIDSSYKMCPQYYQDKLKNCIGWVYELKKFIDNELKFFCEDESYIEDKVGKGPKKIVE